MCNNIEQAVNNKKGHPDYQDASIEATGICAGCKFWSGTRIGMFGCPAPCSKENDVRATFEHAEDWIETMASGLVCPLREDA